MQERRKDYKDLVSKDVCTERHTNIQKTLGRLEKYFWTIILILLGGLLKIWFSGVQLQAHQAEIPKIISETKADETTSISSQK